MEREYQNFYQIFRREGLAFGWKHAKKDLWFFLQIFIVLGIANAIPAIINLIYGWPQDTDNFGDPIAFILSLVFSFGLIKIFLHFVHQKAVSIKDLWNHDRIRFLWWIVARVISGVLIVLGCILLLIPGIYVAARLYLFEYFVVDQNMTAIEAISASWEVTKGHVREIIGIWLLSLGIFILAIIPFGVGLLRAVPTVKLAQATLYKKLSGHAHHIR